MTRAYTKRTYTIGPIQKKKIDKVREEKGNLFAFIVKQEMLKGKPFKLAKTKAQIETGGYHGADNYDIIKVLNIKK